MLLDSRSEHAARMTVPAQTSGSQKIDCEPALRSGSARKGQPPAVSATDAGGLRFATCGGLTAHLLKIGPVVGVAPQKLEREICSIQTGEVRIGGRRPPIL